MRKDVKCSRCGFVVHNDDILYEKRKQRHEEGRHTRHYVVSERDGSRGNKPMGNLDIGKVEWIPIWT